MHDKKHTAGRYLAMSDGSRPGAVVGFNMLETSTDTAPITEPAARAVSTTSDFTCRAIVSTRGKHETRDRTSSVKEDAKVKISRCKTRMLGAAEREQLLTNLVNICQAGGSCSKSIFQRVQAPVSGGWWCRCVRGECIWAARWRGAEFIGRSETGRHVGMWVRG